MTAPLPVHHSFIVKTGLEAFDAARAWGWAVVLNVLTEDDVSIDDEGSWFRVRPSAPLVAPRHALWDNLAGRTLFFDQNWKNVFIAQKDGWKEHVAKVQRILQQQHGNLLKSLQSPGGSPFGEGELLPVGGDPGGFGGSGVREDHWALACLGMSACGTFASIRQSRDRLAIIDVPRHARVSYFCDIDMFRVPGLTYCSIQHAAAHYAVQRVERLLRRPADQGDPRDWCSAILFFNVVGVGRQTAPVTINHLCLDPLVSAIQHARNGRRILDWLDDCLRQGAEDGAEDLALATADLVMRWDMEAYERLVYCVARHQSRGRMKLLEDDTVNAIIRHIRTR